MRTCVKCNHTYPLTSEHFRLSHNKAKSGELKPTWRKTCLECERAYSREYVFKYHRGITHKERDDMLASQGGVCACCSSDDSNSKKGWHVDHCHRSGKIRAVLCANCNIALGMVDDSVEALKKLINYLTRHCEERATTIP